MSGKVGMKNYGPQGGCFTSLTKILTPTGWKFIKDIERNDWVTSYSKGELKACKVLRKMNVSPKRIFTVETKSPKFKVNATVNHALKTNRGWIKIQNIKPNDILLLVNSFGEEQKHHVSKIYDTGKVEPVYNLVVEGSFSFVAEGFIAHSFSRYRTIRMMTNTAFEVIKKLFAQKGSFIFAPQRNYWLNSISFK